ncbi:MAG: FKBP-type peptidyl-prolyl cis-trans isomerase [Bacteroidales bacterium]|nr:FKBP-type peptidyl-prolyl cis-trans isomerase [Bacteroidales bacterium]
MYHLKIIIYITLGIIVTFLYSCKQTSEYEGYSIFQSGLEYKLIEIGEPDAITPKINDFVTILISYATIKDSIFFLNKRKIQITQPQYPSSIDACLLSMKIGDSTSFIINAQHFFEKTLKVQCPSFIDSCKNFKINIKLLEIQSNEDYIRQKNEFLAWIEDFGKYEKVYLQNYLINNKIDTTPQEDGLYKLLIKKGNGIIPKKGDTLMINYEGRFLNGQFFDSTIKRKRTFEYIFGTEWHVIEGMEKALGLMQEGEKSLFIMPSSLAFGQTGSSSGIIPPYTSVIFEVEILKLSKLDTSFANNPVIIE